MPHLKIVLGATIMLAIQAPAQIISTVAGTGSGGYGGDGGQATNATVSAPTGVGVDGSGNFYIADFNNNVIRKVTVATGIITTVAGTGGGGYSGDGGQATNATLNAPEVVAIDAAGNMYEVEQNNNCVRKITVATGIITTVVGISGNPSGGYNGDGIQATTAQLNNPQGVAIDAAGNIYVADQSNNRVRKVTVATGIITTIAGNGGAGYGGDGGQATNANINNPAAVDVDVSGNVYIADYYNNAIRKVTVSTGVITTIAGNGSGGYGGDGGQATNANLNQPYGIDVYGSGDMLIADYGNSAIRCVKVATGIITTIAGGQGGGYCCDGAQATAAKINGPLQAVDYNGTVYIADWNNNRIRKVTNIPLPIQMLSFTATETKGAATLNWSTASEINNNYFTVERTADGTNFEDIAIVKGAGTSSVTHHYSTVDDNPLSGVSYYRLKQTDFDGNFTYSQTVSINNEEASRFTVFPNPVSSALYYTTSGNEQMQITIYDIMGREVLSKSFTSNANEPVKISDGEIAPGVYTVVGIDSKSDRYIKKIVVTK